MSDSYLPDKEPRDILLSLEELAAKKLPHAPTFRKAADKITRLRAALEGMIDLAEAANLMDDPAYVAARKELE